MIPKFRFWHIEKKKMYEVLSIHLTTGMAEVEGGKYFVLQDGFLMQSTGLLDINGKEIFEGDVVRVTCEHPIDFPDCQGVVRMLEGRYMVCDDKTERGSELFSEIFSNEIIGSIYENPELMEELE